MPDYRRRKSREEMTVRLDANGIMADAIGAHGLGRDAIEALAPRVSEIARNLRERRMGGEIGFYDLPGDRASIDATRNLAAELRSEFDSLVVLGIGGSALGTKTILGALPDASRSVHVADNVDPSGFGRRMMAAKKRNYYSEARFEEVDESHPIDDEIERRLHHTTLRKQIRSAQDRLMAALGEQRHLFLRLEELIGNRAMDREEAMFNLGFEHGLVLGRADALAAALRQQGARGRALARRLIQLASSAGLEPPRALAVLLEVAWGLALGTRKPPVAPRSRRTRSADDVAG